MKPIDELTLDEAVLTLLTYRPDAIDEKWTVDRGLVTLRYTMAAPIAITANMSSNGSHLLELTVVIGDGQPIQTVIDYTQTLYWIQNWLRDKARKKAEDYLEQVQAELRKREYKKEATNES